MQYKMSCGNFNYTGGSRSTFCDEFCQLLVRVKEVKERSIKGAGALYISEQCLLNYKSNA